MRSSSARSWRTNAASSSPRTICGKASPMVALASRPAVATASRQRYGRMSGHSRASVRGDGNDFTSPHRPHEPGPDRRADGRVRCLQRWGPRQQHHRGGHDDL